jgi:LmbE family N-acetylglucosaminyl deacetylase/O-antigen/teichoic acid export membrane protein
MTSLIEKLVPSRLIDSARSLRVHIRTPLYANAYLLILNQGLSAGLGIIYWVIAARFYSPDMVGKGSAIISTLGFLSAIAELSLKSGMQRFVPRAGKHVRSLVLRAYTVNLVVTGIITVAFMVLGSQLHFSDDLLGGLSPVSLIWLVLATMIYTIFIVQDGVLMGLHQTLWVLLENTIYNVAKIVMLVIGIFGILGNGIVASWFIPAPLVVLMVNGLVFLRFIPRFLRPNQTPVKPIQPREIVTSVAGDHVGTVLSETSIRLLPLLVINLLGTSANAYFYQAWLIGNMLYLVCSNVSASFTVEGASDPTKLAYYSQQSLRQMIFLIIPMILVLLGGAPFILRIYGGKYALEATPLLRWLTLAALPYGVNAWFLSYSRIRVNIKAIILNQGLQCVITLGLSYLWMPQYGIASIGLAWLIAQTINAVLVVLRMHRILFGKARPEEGGPADLQPGEYLPQKGLEFLSTDSGNPQPMKPSGATNLFLSPHLDDAVLSCGGYISRLAAAGERVIIATLFTADLPEGEPVSWLAQRNLRAWRMYDTQSPFAERCQEDLRAARRLGVETIHLGLLDGMYRRKQDGTIYYSKNTVGVPLDKEDEALTGAAVQGLLREIAERYGPSEGLTLFAPLGIGGHVDHVLVRSSAEAVFGQAALTYYEEIPYVVRKENSNDLPFNTGVSQTSETWIPSSLTLTPAEMEARIEASACYESQIQGLFPTQMERNLEILLTRVPILIKPLYGRYQQMGKQKGARERVARSLSDYIHQAGEEKYWNVSSPLSGVGAYEKAQVFSKK